MSILIQLLIVLSLATGIPQDAPPEQAAGQIHMVTLGPFEASFKASARFIPAYAEEIAFEPEEYSGKLQILEVVEHGSRVRAGDVLIRFNPEFIDDQIENSHIELRSAEQRLEGALANKRIAEMNWKASMEGAEYDLEVARTRLTGYEEIELPLIADENRLQQQYREHSIEDQKDELEQLGKMYKEDALTEETEEIVLKRSERNLQRSIESMEVSKRRRDYNVGYSERLALQNLIRDAEAKSRALEKLKVQGESQVVLAEIEVERACRNVEKIKKSLEGLMVDRARMEIKSPMDGILIHASRKLEGTRLKRWKSVGFYDPFLTVAEPGILEASFTVGEADFFKIRDGMEVECKPKAWPDEVLEGVVNHIDPLPDLQNASWPCTARLEGKHGDLLPGMSCDLDVIYRSYDKVVTVPVEAVVREKGEAHCTVVTDSGVTKRAVVLGEESEGMVVVKEGLKEGDRLVIKN